MPGLDEQQHEHESPELPEVDDRTPEERFTDSIEEDQDQTVWVRKREGKDWLKLAEIPAHEYEPDAVAAKFGTGTYKLRLRHNESKEWGLQCTVALRAPDATPSPTPAPPVFQPLPPIPTPAPAASAGTGQDVLLVMIQSLMQQNTAMLQTMVAQTQQRTSAPTSEILAAIKLGQEMSAKPERDDEDDEVEADTFGKIASMVARFIPGSPQQPAAPASPALPAPSQEGKTLAIEHIIRAAIASPVPMPHVWADALIGQLGADVARQAVQQPDALVGLVIESYPDLESSRELLRSIEGAMRTKLVPPGAPA